MKNNDTVDNLKKVKLLIEAGTSPDKMDLTSDPLPYEFIFGIGSGGLTAFEYKLAGRSKGDKISLPVSRDVISELFGHLIFPLNELSGIPDIFHLDIKIEKVSHPKNKEIIRAMSQAGGECGCGCGGHGSDSRSCGDHGCGTGECGNCGCA